MFVRLVVVMCVVLWSGTVQAIEYYVDGSGGSDGNPGVEASPFATIQKCTDVMTTTIGNTCYVKNGTYAGDIWIRYSGGATTPNVYRNYPGHAPIINPGSIRLPGGNGTVRMISVQSVNGSNQVIANIVIDGFEITNGWHGTRVDNGTNIVWRNNNIHHNDFSGIVGTCFNCTVTKNRIAFNGDLTTCFGVGSPDGCNVDHGTYLTGQLWTITENLFEGNQAYGISANSYTFQAGVHASTNHAGFGGIIAKNTFAYEYYRNGIVFWNVSGTQVSATRVENNLFFQNCSRFPSCVSTAIDNQDASLAGVSIKNNYDYATASGGVATSIINGAGSATLANNTSTSSVSPGITTSGGSGEPNGSQNYTPAAGSPLINAGLINEFPYNGTAPDIGYIETGAVVDTTPPAAPTGVVVN